MKDQKTITKLVAAKPVYPTTIRRHGLFGLPLLKQHMVIDEQWSMGDLVDEYHGMANLLEKRVIFKKLQNKAYRLQLYKSAHHLRTQCRGGRTNLQNILYGKSVKGIRKYLLNCKELQRLYQKMPVDEVVDNIGQRTFVMRKERDRLTNRLNTLKREYEMKLLERANLEDRIKYENEFILEEEIKSREILEHVEKSKTRFKAIKTIHSTYQKVFQILRHDEIFFEPILQGLSDDIDDQANFIKHILYLGTPAIEEFRKLSKEYRLLQESSRHSSHHAIQTIAGFKKITPKQSHLKSSKVTHLAVNISKRYARETKSMLKLKDHLVDIESIMKQIKIATMCSKAKQVFPRFGFHIKNNSKFIKQNALGQIKNDFLTLQEKLATEKQNVLLHYYSEEEEQRSLQIQSLEEQIKAQDTIEENTLHHIKSQSNIFVVLRYSLWNLSDILRFVGRPLKVNRIKYPNSYLKLPLLKFEMLTMRARPPDLFEEDTKVLLSSVEKKIKILMQYFSALTDVEFKMIEELRKEFHDDFLATQEIEENLEEIGEEHLALAEGLIEESKALQYIPNRSQIKLQSAKIVEERSKKEDLT